MKTSCFWVNASPKTVDNMFAKIRFLAMPETPNSLWLSDSQNGDGNSTKHRDGQEHTQHDDDRLHVYFPVVYFSEKKRIKSVILFHVLRFI